MGTPAFANGLLAIATGAFWLCVFVFWVVVGWRAMRALEGIEETLRRHGPR